jgi:hypothetical protein
MKNNNIGLQIVIVAVLIFATPLMILASKAVAKNRISVPSVEAQDRFLAAETVTLSQFGDSQDIIKVIDVPRAVDKTGLYTVKLQMTTSGGGGYVTVITSDTDLRVGQEVKLLKLKLQNTTSTDGVQIAVRKPTPVGH